MDEDEQSVGSMTERFLAATDVSSSAGGAGGGERGAGEERRKGSGDGGLHVANMGFWQAVAVAVNYCVGSGILTLPWAFQQSGVAMGIIFLAFMAVACDISKDYLLETMARANVIARKEASGLGGGGDATSVGGGGHGVYAALKSATIGVGSGSGENGALNGNGSGSGNRSANGNGIGNDSGSESGTPSAADPPGTYTYGNINATPDGNGYRDGSAVVGGEGMDDYEGEDSYAASFRTSLMRTAHDVSHQPGGSHHTEVGGEPSTNRESLILVEDRKFEVTELCERFLGVRGRQVYTAVICIYLYGSLWAYSSIFANSLAGQIGMGSLGNGEAYAVYLTIFAVILVPVTCLEISEQVSVQVVLAICRVLLVVFMVGSVLAAYAVDNGPFEDQAHPKGTTAFVPSKIYIMLPIAIYANIYHHSLPALSQPVRDKRELSAIFRTVFALCGVGYCIMGSTIASYFGNEIDSSSNLNWRHYNGTRHGGEQWWAYLVGGFIVLFPALDVSSAFQLNGITISNNIMSSWYGLDMARMEQDRWNVIKFRFVGTIPPLVGAYFVRDLGVITDYTGITGFAIAFIFPALLQITSSARMQKLGLEPRTAYWNALSTKSTPVAMLFGGVFVCFFIFISFAVWGPP